MNINKCSLFFIFLKICPSVLAKGVAVIGGKGNREVCPDCPDNYNPEELTWALVTLGIVTSVFLSICFCRCYPKFKLIFLDNPADNVKLRCTNKSDRQTPINDFHNNQEALTKMEERCSCESQPSQSAPFGYKYAAHVPQRQLNLCQI